MCVCVCVCQHSTQKPLDILSPNVAGGQYVAVPGHQLFLVAIRFLSWILDHFPRFFSYERISTKLFGDVGRGLRTNRLFFGGDLLQDSDPRFLSSDRDPYLRSKGQMSRLV